MDLLDLINATGGSDGIRELAGSTGLGADDATKLVGALGPALLSGLKKNTADDSGLKGLRRALESGGHQRYLDDPQSIRSDDARADCNKILGHLFGSKDVSRNVAARASQDTGIDAGLIRKALPLVAGLAMGALSKSSSPEAPADSESGLGGLLGALVGGGSSGAGGVDDLLDLAKRLF